MLEYDEKVRETDTIRINRLRSEYFSMSHTVAEDVSLGSLLKLWRSVIKQCEDQADYMSSTVTRKIHKGMEAYKWLTSELEPYKSVRSGTCVAAKVDERRLVRFITKTRGKLFKQATEKYDKLRKKEQAKIKKVRLKNLTKGRKALHEKRNILKSFNSQKLRKCG